MSTGLPPLTQRVLRSVWTTMAALEQTAAVAFRQLREQLDAIDAPTNLLARMERARREEAEHAERCFRLATRFGGRPVEPVALPAIDPVPPPLNRLAADQVLDGCLMEAYAAAVAADGCRTAYDPEVRETLAVIARDEARHAEDAYALLGWLLEVGDASVARAVECQLERLPRRAPTSSPLWWFVQDPSPHGFPTRGRARELFARTRAEAVARVGRMLNRVPAGPV